MIQTIKDLVGKKNIETENCDVRQFAVSATSSVGCQVMERAFFERMIGDDFKKAGAFD